MFITTYLTYLLPTLFIIIVVGKKLHSNGYFYILEIHQGDKAITQNINNLLLLGYYLVNIGYAIYVLSALQPQPDFVAVINQCSSYIAAICFILFVLHLINMAALDLLRKKINL